MATSLSQNPTQGHLQAEITYRRSVLLRSEAHISESDLVIQEFLNRQSLDPKQGSHLLGLLHISQANNHIYHFDFSRAREQLRKWHPSDNELSEGELRVLCDQICCNGRILRGEGRFDEAKVCFEGCLRTPGLPSSKRRLIVSQLADVYCELHYATGQIAYLNTAREVVQPEIDSVRACCPHSKALRRLLLSLSEIEIRLGHHDNAEHLIDELLNIYNILPEPDINDKLGHVRTLIASARISLPSEAEQRWRLALLQNKVYNPFEEEVFTCGVIYLFICCIQLGFGDADKGREAFHHAAEVICRKRPQYLIPGVGTYLFDFVRQELRSRAGWILSNIAQ